MRSNETFRLYAKFKGVKLREVAERLHMHPSNFSRYIKNELSDAALVQLSIIVNEIAKEREAK